MLFRKFFLFFITCLFLLQIVGQFPMFKIAQNKIHKKVKKLVLSNIPNQFLTQITISPNNKTQIKWVKANKEFWYQGIMYDVVRVAIPKNSIDSQTYYCIQDTEETQLITNFENTNNPFKQKNSVLSWDFAKKIVATDFPIVSFITENSPFILSIHKEKLQSFYSNFYQFHFLASIDFPPEKV